MPTKKKQSLTPEQAKQILNKRWTTALAAVTPSSLARGHQAHLEIYQSEATNLLLYCSRRAGKTEVILGLLLLTSMNRAGVSCLYLGHTSKQVKKIWRRWKKLLRDFDLPASHDETDIETELHNGSRIVFGSIDDRAHIQTYLGDSMAGGMACVDESQSQNALLEELVKEILGPMIAEVTKDHPVPGRLVVAGTAVDSAGGFFDTLYEANAVLSPEGAFSANKPDSEWACFSFTRWHNPHELDNDARLASYCKTWNIAPTDPFILQTWFGLRVFDANATCYRYSKDRNAYQAQFATWSTDLALPPGTLTARIPPNGIDLFSCGIDAGSHDRTGIVLWGWSSKHVTPGIWQVAEWTTERHTPIHTTQIYEVLKRLKLQYGKVIRWIRDDGSSQTIDDTLRVEHGILIEPPIKGKGSKKARVERLADLLQTGRAHVIEGSELETDLMLCRWNQNMRAEGKWDFDDSIIHPDIADAATYGLVPFLEAPGREAPPVYTSETQAAVAAQQMAFKEQFRCKPKAPRKRDSKGLW